jgi:hypothetical protein
MSGRRPQVFPFSSLRSDWYRSNQALPRAIRQTVDGTRKFLFHGFPRQWIPLFAWFGVPWKKSVAPLDYLPFFSDLSEQQLEKILCRARDEDMLRPMLESASTLDPVISDCLYILDHSVKARSEAMTSESTVDRARPRKTLLLTSWQAYGRPSVVGLEQKVAEIPARGDVAAMLPCSFRRPYDRSPTHRRIYARLKQCGYDVGGLHKIVVTSLGIIPEELWSSPAVVQYDAGVPDIYRLLRLLRTFFATRRYRYVVDCLEFPVYSDLLQIVQREGLIADLRRLDLPRRRAFYVRPPRSVPKPR